jgi:hypothetical protein
MSTVEIVPGDEVQYVIAGSYRHPYLHRDLIAKTHPWADGKRRRMTKHQKAQGIEIIVFRQYNTTANGSGWDFTVLFPTGNGMPDGLPINGWAYQPSHIASMKASYAGDGIWSHESGSAYEVSISQGDAWTMSRFRIVRRV